MEAGTNPRPLFPPRKASREQKTGQNWKTRIPHSHHGRTLISLSRLESGSYWMGLPQSPGSSSLSHPTSHHRWTSLVGPFKFRWNKFPNGFAQHLKECGLPSGSAAKNPAAVQEPQQAWVRSLDGEDPLAEDMETRFSIPAWRTTCTEELGSLQSTGSQRVELDWSHLARRQQLKE